MVLNLYLNLIWINWCFIDWNLSNTYNFIFPTLLSFFFSIFLLGLLSFFFSYFLFPSFLYLIFYPSPCLIPSLFYFYSYSRCSNSTSNGGSYFVFTRPLSILFLFISSGDVRLLVKAVVLFISGVCGCIYLLILIVAISLIKT